MTTTKISSMLALVTATSGLAAASQFAIDQKSLPGFTLSYQGTRDWAIFTDVSGAPASCLEGTRFAAGVEQSWRSANGNVRVDFGTFETAGAALSAAREAALMLNNATQRTEGAETIGDASWRTEVGDPTFVVQRGNVVFYISAQSAQISGQQIIDIARAIVDKAANAPAAESPAQIACDVETYAGLSLMKPNPQVKHLLAQLGSERSNRAQVAAQLKRSIQALSPTDIDPAARANLLRAIAQLQ